MNADQASESFWRQHPVLKEFICEQIPLVVGVFVVGILVSYLEYGYLPGADRPFPIAGIRVPIWHLLWMGFWTGYTMGIVGQAAGIFLLPYTMSVLQFSSVSVSSTTLIVTFLNPLGALLGFWREKQWNIDLALWLSLGAFFGSPIGPFIRVFFLSDPVPFKCVTGIALLLMAIDLCMQLTPWYLSKNARQRSFKEKFDNLMNESFKAGKAPSGLPEDFRIVTLARSWKHFTIGYWGERQTFNIPLMVFIGFIVGVVSSALGAGGGFLLVPILVSFFGMPMYVLVAATIPYVIILSITGLLSFTVTLPLLTGISTPPDWSFALFASSGAIFGAWLASKTQKFIPEEYLKPMLGAVTGTVGILYVINYFWRLPFSI
ncbi:MAG: sulfite exporter TauE/SafE family protein [Desulfobaccales bacterium]